MKILLDIPYSDIPKTQDFISISLHFIDGKVCECDYPFEIIESEETNDSKSHV